MERNVRTPMQRAARLAAGQKGLVTLDQARGAGLSDDQVLYAAEHGGWEHLARRLYALPGSVPGWDRDALAACLLCGDDAVLSHLTAAAVFRWVAPPVLPHVTVPPRHSSRTPLARVHRSVVPRLDRTRRDGLRCTTPSRTIVDCAGMVERSRLEDFIDDAICGRVASVASIREAADRAGRRGRRGMPALEAALAAWSEDISPGSPAEVRLLRRLATLGLTGVVTQHEVHDGDGGFVARLDVAVPERLHAFEYDADRWHNPRRYARDEGRLERLEALGWRVDAVCKHDLLPSSTRLAELVAAGADTDAGARTGGRRAA